MFKSINENEFRQAIKNKDYTFLKVSTASTMRDDPTFERGETMKALQILQEQVPEIFEDEVKLGYEERLEKSEWDKRYFTKLTYWFQQNFAISRIDYIREVGKVVHRDTAQQYKQSMEMNKNKPPVSKRTSPNVSGHASGSQKVAPPKPNAKKESPSISTERKAAKPPEVKKVNFPVAGVIVAAGALVLAGIVLAKLL